VARPEEMRAAGRLVGDALGGAVDVVRDVHGAVARRVTRFLPPAAAPVTRLHGAITGLSYAGTAAAHRVVPAAGAEVVSRTWRAGPTSFADSPWGRALLPTVNGLWGDTVAARYPALAVPMAVRVDDRDVATDGASVARAFPAATSRVAVFVHGLVEDDRSWWRHPGPEGVPHPGSYGDRLRDDLGVTPVYVRYNTGRRVSDNGRSLARLLDALTSAWPVPVHELSLVGHSMGGLVARSACHDGDRAGSAWVPAVRAVVALGTPHLGAPLEKGVHLADWLLSRLPETAPLSRSLRGRSVGVKDLRFGAVVEEDWSGHDPDELLHDRCTDVPFLGHATYCFVASSMTRDPRHPAGRLLGDGLVRYPSASGAGRTRRVPFDVANGAHVGGVGHLMLLNHPDVYRRLRAWLTAASCPCGPRPAA